MVDQVSDGGINMPEVTSRVHPTGPWTEFCSLGVGQGGSGKEGYPQYPCSPSPCPFLVPGLCGAAHCLLLHPATTLFLG